ncbi:hypothetical protein BNJ_00363 [Kaumoebavirus]|uniref:hypothetical protein n=1 Tax=Kaumoebavirus TaxID=1859492 RepID=UPI0009C29C25|nr:hypothetical protein BNJ_00363 [Kaumoebavirus]ARA72183.1 hypothetical protein BNJ_00363 [Kaumoebavirus]
MEPLHIRQVQNQRGVWEYQIMLKGEWKEWNCKYGERDILALISCSENGIYKSRDKIVDIGETIKFPKNDYEATETTIWDKRLIEVYPDIRTLRYAPEEFYKPLKVPGMTVEYLLLKSNGLVDWRVIAEKVLIYLGTISIFGILGYLKFVADLKK